MDKYFENCILCGSASITNMPRYQRDFLCRCSQCGFVFARKQPPPHELEKYYSEYSYDREYFVSPITIKRYREILQVLEPYRQTNRLLDVGCGNGIFLTVAAEMGWEVYGVELSGTGVQRCHEKGLSNVHKGVLADVASVLPKMDVAISIEVIEHIQSPVEELSLKRKVLRPGGAIYITTPNFNSLLRLYKREKSSDIAYPEHLSYYTPRTLKLLMERNGFATRRLECTGFSITQLRNTFAPEMQNPFTGSSTDEQVRVALEREGVMKYIKSLLNGVLNLTGTGNSLKGLFELSPP